MKATTEAIVATMIGKAQPPSPRPQTAPINRPIPMKNSMNSTIRKTLFRLLRAISV